MSRLLPYVICIALLGAVAWLTIETRQLAERAGQSEAAAHEAMEELAWERERVAAIEAARAGEREAVDELESDFERSVREAMRLEGELGSARQQLEAMADHARLLRERVELHTAEAKAEGMRRLAPMPAGVRLCLATLHACLGREGFVGLRFLRASGVDAMGLHDVEAVHTHPDGLQVDLLFAGRMTATVQRAEQQLSLRFFDGLRASGGERHTLPEEGWEIVVFPILGQMLEEKLPYLMVAEGEYPPDATARDARLPTDVDAVTRQSWLDRLGLLLEGAGTDERIVVRRFRGIEGAAFLEARLIATDEKGHVQFGAGCERLSVEVDRKAKVVSLLLSGGSLQRGQATSTITSSGMRILLPDVTPEQAIDTMLGMVDSR